MEEEESRNYHIHRELDTSFRQKNANVRGTRSVGVVCAAWPKPKRHRVSLTAPLNRPLNPLIKADSGRG